MDMCSVCETPEGCSSQRLCVVSAGWEFQISGGAGNPYTRSGEYRVGADPHARRANVEARLERLETFAAGIRCGICHVSVAIPAVGACRACTRIAVERMAG